MTAATPVLATFLNPDSAWDGTRPNDVFLGNHEAAHEVTAPSPKADTLSRLLDLLDDHGEDDYGPLAPTQYAFKSAFKLVREAQKQMALRVAGSPSVDSLGGVRITWRHGDREIRLVCPADREEQSYVYQESERQNQAILGLTPAVLADKLSWLVFGGDIL